MHVLRDFFTTDVGPMGLGVIALLLGNTPLCEFDPPP